MNASDKTGKDRRKSGGGWKRRVRVGRDAQNPDFERNNLFVLQSTNYTYTACMRKQPLRSRGSWSPDLKRFKTRITLSRYNQTTRDNGNCHLCGSSKKKTKFTFFFVVLKVLCLGNNFYDKVKTLIPNITQLLVKVLINEMISSRTHLITLSVYNSWNIFQLALTFATNYLQSSLRPSKKKKNVSCPASFFFWGRLSFFTC